MSAHFSKLLASGLPPFKSLPFGYRKPTAPTTTAPWPEEPFRLIHDTGAKARTEIPADHFCRKNAVIMAQTHNSIFRGLNAIYQQAAQVHRGTQDATDLLAYCAATHEFIHTHHLAEETAYFPAIEAAAGVPGLMDGNVEQHRGLEESLERFRRYATETSLHTYDADELRQVIESMVGPVGQHMRDEIPTILDLHDMVSSTQLEKAYAELHHKAAQSDLWKAGPFVYGCQDHSFELDGQKLPFPEMPAVVPYLIAYIVSIRYAGAWRFNPSSAFGRVRPCTGRPTQAQAWSRDAGVGSWSLWLRLLIGGLGALVVAFLVGAYVRTVS